MTAAFKTGFELAFNLNWDVAGGIRTSVGWVLFVLHVHKLVRYTLTNRVLHTWSHWDFILGKGKELLIKTIIVAVVLFVSPFEHDKETNCQEYYQECKRNASNNEASAGLRIGCLVSLW